MRSVFILFSLTFIGHFSLAEQAQSPLGSTQKATYQSDVHAKGVEKLIGTGDEFSFYLNKGCSTVKSLLLNSKEHSDYRMNLSDKTLAKLKICDTVKSFKAKSYLEVLEMMAERYQGCFDVKFDHPNKTIDFVGGEKLVKIIIQTETMKWHHRGGNSAPDNVHNVIGGRIIDTDDDHSFTTEQVYYCGFDMSTATETEKALLK